MLLLALLGLAHADDRASWGDLHLALLVESADGDAASARAVYEQLVRKLPSEDPIRAEALYWLARSRWLAGDERARAALLEGIRTGACKERCFDLLERIELDANAITTVPIAWDFETPEHGVFHPWRYDHKGTMRLGTPPGKDESALVWSTAIDVRTEDQLVVGFSRPQPPPKQVSFRIRADPVEAWIRVFAEDGTGRTFTSGGVGMLVPVNDTLDLTIDLDRMVATDGTGDTLDPARIARLRLVDTTGFEGEGVGQNTLYLDDFIVR
ncbi:MAG: hypothetical protein ACI8PZ_002883 [Myxococcota bacterium]